VSNYRTSLEKFHSPLAPNLPLKYVHYLTSLHKKSLDLTTYLMFAQHMFISSHSCNRHKTIFGRVGILQRHDQNHRCKQYYHTKLCMKMKDMKCSQIRSLTMIHQFHKWLQQGQKWKLDNSMLVLHKNKPDCHFNTIQLNIFFILLKGYYHGFFITISFSILYIFLSQDNWNMPVSHYKTQILVFKDTISEFFSHWRLQVGVGAVTRKISFLCYQLKR